MGRKFKIGTRKSELAMWQAEFVKWLLDDQWPDDEFEIVGLTTSGDDKSLKLSEAGGKGLYIKEVEEALLRNEIDLCVHSLKDMPSELAPDCELVAIVERGEVRDVFISRDKMPLAAVKPGMKIGTSSLRRKSQLNSQGVKVELVDIRGNVDTRLEKLESGEVDGLILAGAGLLRLGRENVITEYLDPYSYVPAPGQGAIAVECRRADDDLRLKLKKIHDDHSGQAVEAERTFMTKLGGSCVLPLGAWCQIEQFQMRLRGFLSNAEGTQVMIETIVGPVGHGIDLGEKLADRFLAQGARKILEGL